jgi:hypothetical protein
MVPNNLIVYICSIGTSYAALVPTTYQSHAHVNRIYTGYIYVPY